MAESKEKLKSLLISMKEESERASLKLNIKKKKHEDHGIRPHYFMANRGGKGGSCDRFPLWGALKSLQMVTAAMKSEDNCFLAGKL